MTKTTSKHYRKEWLSEDRVLVCRFYDTSAEAADEWLADIRHEYEQWPEQQPILLLMDLREVGGMVSPRGLFRSAEAARLRPDLPGRTAVLINNKAVQAVMSQLLDAVTHGTADRERKIFTNEHEAVVWLMGLK